MKKCLFFNPHSALAVYSKSKIKDAIPKLATVSLASLAGSLLEEGCDVKIVDLIFAPVDQMEKKVKEEMLNFKPDLIGVTATTPLFYEAAKISDIAKSVSKDILTILGGPHSSALPLASLKESSFDAVVVGEGENVIKTIAKQGNAFGVKGVYTSRDPEDYPSVRVQKTDEVPIDSLPMPAFHLFDANKYICPRVIARHNPVAPIEISRGCVFNCDFCSKRIFGRKFRVKHPKRIIEELKELKKLGYREFHVIDDQFTTDIDKAKEMCEEIIRNNIDMTWNLRAGIRADMVDEEFLKLAKRSGCYQMGVGFESGNQSSLDNMHKGLSLEQSIKAAHMAKNAGIEVAGFFILGWPGETRQDMEETIRFAISLGIDYAKATILVPFPGTALYDDFEQKGFLKIKDWSRYNFHDAHEIYQHPSLSWECLNYYYRLFHRRFYFRPGYIAKEAWKALLSGRLLDDIYTAVRLLIR